MGLYSRLDAAIQGCSRDELEYKRFKELVTKHFEGTAAWQSLPDCVKLAIAEFENEQQDGTYV